MVEQHAKGVRLVPFVSIARRAYVKISSRIQVIEADGGSLHHHVVSQRRAYLQAERLNFVAAPCADIIVVKASERRRHTPRLALLRGPSEGTRINTGSAHCKETHGNY